MRNIFILIIFLFSSNILAQGCSDAGICSVGNGFFAENISYKNQIEVGNIVGKGLEDVFYISPYLSYTRQFTEQFSLISKVTFTSASGSFGTNTNLSDAFLIGNYKFKENNKKQWSGLLGIKIPLTKSNDQIKNISVPLDYQTSLGTYDIFLGADYKFNKWNLNTAIQLPIINNNKNTYFDEFNISDKFPTTNSFERKPDVLLRGIYTFNSKSKKFTYKPNLLVIYHLGNDTFKNTLGNIEKIKNSEGLTINANFITNYQLKENKIFEVSIAFPLVFREIRPDGLTRVLTLGVNYKYSF